MDRGPIEINNHRYILSELNAFEQLHVSRRIAPVLFPPEAAEEIISSGSDALESIGKELFLKIGPHLLEAFAKMSDVDVEYVIGKCLRRCQREGAKGWAPVMANNGHFMFDDITMPEMVQLTVKTMMANLSGFFPTAPPASGAAESVSES